MDRYSSVVLFCIIRRIRETSAEVEYLLMPKIGYEPSFPATKFRNNEDLYDALGRIITSDWIEVEALHCHFGYWTTREGYGTVIKAAGTGELAGVGHLGVSGKTICKECPVEKQCQKHPEILPILQEYQKIFEDRNWELIRQSVK